MGLIGVMRRAPMMRGPRIARIMRLMRRVRVIPVASIMMGLRLRARKAKGRDRDQGCRRHTSEPAHLRATVTQRHETPRRLLATVRPRRRSQLRYAHGRERYAGAVTQRLTGFRSPAAISPQAVGIALGARPMASRRIKPRLSEWRLSIEIIYSFYFCWRLPFRPPT